jgi:Cytochrome C oxidase, cbb3-type, subunit III
MILNQRAAGLAVFLLAAGLGFAEVALGPRGADAQLRDPPPGWDMWDPGWSGPEEMWNPQQPDPSLRGRIDRHEAFRQSGVPEPYRGASNPLSRTPDTVHDGGRLYAENCARCHDPAGLGHGEAGLALYPSPALLARLVRTPAGVDEYLLWAISEGGGQFGSKMPAFKEVLSQEQIWQIVTYMRAGFPEQGATREN